MRVFTLIGTTYCSHITIILIPSGARSEVISKITGKLEYERPASGVFEKLMSPKLYVRAPRGFCRRVDTFLYIHGRVQ